MAKRVLSTASVTLAAIADTSALTNTNYIGAIQGGTSTQYIDIIECYVGGQNTSSSVEIMVAARDSTVAVTSSGSNTVDAPMNPFTAALGTAPLTGNSFSTNPQRSSAQHLVNLTLNAFGGIVRWVAAPGEEMAIYGTAVNIGEFSLSAFTGSGTGLVGGSIVYEPK